MTNVYLLLGSNCGERESFLLKAYSMINNQIGEISTASSVYETEPWGFESADYFLNRVVLAKTALRPAELMSKVLEIEALIGRTRTNNFAGYQNRIIDIDILFYSNEIIKSDAIKVPHPELHNRKFALLPLMEIAAGFIHPVLQKTIKQLYDECPDTLKVTNYKTTNN